MTIDSASTICANS